VRHSGAPNLRFYNHFPLSFRLPRPAVGPEAGQLLFVRPENLHLRLTKNPLSWAAEVFISKRADEMVTFSPLGFTPVWNRGDSILAPYLSQDALAT
jgi:hypothetical protein